MLKKNLKTERGQSIVLIALMFVGLLAFIGLTVDVGVLFISYGNLRQAVDNAAIAASTQMRTMYQIDELKASASQFLRLNNIDISEGSVNVQTCKTNPSDTQLCPVNERRKLVRVTATVPVKFSFLPIIGMYETNITATAVGEAASLDVVLVVDISESMSRDSVNVADRDPKICNANSSTVTTPSGGTATIPGNCMPFTDVKKAAALTFASTILDKPKADEEDRLAIVVFSNGWEASDLYYTPSYATGPTIPIHGTAAVCPYGYDTATGECDDAATDADGNWTSDYDVAYDLLTHLKVYEVDPCVSNYATLDDPRPCAYYSPNPSTGLDEYQGQQCGFYHKYADSSTCLTTNIGGGLKLGASMFSGMNMRKDSLWLVVLLTDGAANASEVTADSNNVYFTTWGASPANLFRDLPAGWCPDGTKTTGNCRDNDVTTRHNLAADPTHYDADDFARDMADLVACDAKDPATGCNQAGQGALLFSIGLGDKVIDAKDANLVPYGESMLRYAANVGEDGDPATGAGSTDPCYGVTSGDSCGNYYYTSDSNELQAIFESIASRVFTRLAK